MLDGKWRILLLLPPLPPPPPDDDDDIDDDDGLLFVTTPKRPFRRPLPDDEMGEEAPMVTTVVTARANAMAAAW